MGFLLRCFQQFSPLYIATQRIPLVGRTGRPAVHPFRSSRTMKGFPQCSNVYTGYGPNCLTHVIPYISIEHGLYLHPLFGYIIKELAFYIILVVAEGDMISYILPFCPSNISSYCSCNDIPEVRTFEEGPEVMYSLYGE